MLVCLLALSLLAAHAEPAEIDQNAQFWSLIEEGGDFTSDEARDMLARIEARAAEGHAPSRNTLGVILQNGIGRDQDLAAAEAVFRALMAEEGLEQIIVDSATLNLASVLSEQGRAQEALPLLQTVRERGGELAGQALDSQTGMMTSLARSPADMEPVEALLEAGLETGHITLTGLHHLADIYLADWRVGGRDPAAARRVLDMAEAQGDAEAMWRLAMLDRDDAARHHLAFDRVRQAAEAGYGEAMISMAVMLATGELTARDSVAARHWYTAAAGRGSAHAHRGLAGMLITGDGGEPDAALGYALLDLAVEGGDEMAPQMRALLPDYGFARPPEADIRRARADWLARTGLTPDAIGPTR